MNYLEKEESQAALSLFMCLYMYVLQLTSSHLMTSYKHLPSLGYIEVFTVFICSVNQKAKCSNYNEGHFKKKV